MPKAIVPISGKQIIFVIFYPFADKFCTVAFAPGVKFVPSLAKL